jgi:uncharacterized protein (TIGR00369 family)
MRSAPALPPVDPSFRADLRDAIHAMPASIWLGLFVRGFSAAGVAVIELPLRPQLTFDGRVAQGGVVGMLADYAGVSAASCTLPPLWMASTLGYEVHNIAPAVGSRLLAVGRAQAVGRSHAVSRVEVWAQAAGTEANAEAEANDALTLVAVATTTCRPFQIKPGS